MSMVGRRIGMKSRRLANLTVVAAAALAVVVAAAASDGSRPAGAAAARWTAPPDAAPLTLEDYRTIVPRMSPDAALFMARRLGMTSLAGKPLLGGRATSSRRLVDGVAIANNPLLREDSPQAAINPIDENNIVIVHTRVDVPGDSAASIYYKTSFDGGVTFPIGGALPGPATFDFTTSPDVQFTPDGRYALACYAGHTPVNIWFAVVCRSDDGGANWSYLTHYANAAFVFGSTSLAVHKHDRDRAGIFYLNMMLISGESGTVYSRKYVNYGDFYLQSTLSDPLGGGEHQGVRGVGLKGSDKMALAWYDSGTDGLRKGKFQIEAAIVDWEGGTTYSIAAPALANELGYYLGPTEPGSSPARGLYHAWWQNMWPAIDVTPDNRVLIAWTQDPAAGQATAEEGNVYYTYNTDATYTRWVAKKLLASSGTAAQGYQALATQRMVDGTSRVYFTYASYDAASKNKYYDIYKRISLNGGLTFGAPVKVTKYRSLSQYMNCGIRNGIATHPRLAFAVWNDRATAWTVNDACQDVDVLGAVID